MRERHCALPGHHALTPEVSRLESSSMSQTGPQPITFDEALDRTKTFQRHLLLGNGFSINARPSFRYQSLFEKAQPFSAEVARLFHDLNTQDFEEVLEILRQQTETSPTKELQLHEEEIRAAFVRSISTVHPENSMFMSRTEANRCATFLEHFVGRIRPDKLRGRVYTTNYDLLLYWVVARFGRKLWCYDSHICPVEDKRYGIWHPEKEPNLVYLHGGLHLYDWGKGQGMLRYDGHRSLIEQIRTRLDRGRFPVIVTEGTSAAKVARIQRSEYLKWSSRYFRSGLRGNNVALFTYGHSLSERDAHLLSLIGEGRTETICLGVYGGLHDQCAAVYDWTAAWTDARLRRGEAAPEVWVYDTSTFSPWR